MLISPIVKITLDLFDYSYHLLLLFKATFTLWEADRETVETVSDFIFGAPKSLQMVIAAMKLKDAYSFEGKLWQT